MTLKINYLTAVDCDDQIVQYPIIAWISQLLPSLFFIEATRLGNLKDSTYWTSALPFIAILLPE